MKVIRKAAQVEAAAAGDHALTDHLANVEIRTIDGAMGRDKTHVVVDTMPGHFEAPERLLVAFPRAKRSMVIVGLVCGTQEVPISSNSIRFATC
jgi:hypothetical protein